MDSVFLEYVSNFDMNNKDIKRKYLHSLRVKKINYNSALKLGWNDVSCKLAKIIGLLHDYGRFTQIKVYNTFNDLSSMDHANYGVKLLFDDNHIRNFINDNKYDDIIKFAIKNHNKYDIESCDNEEAIKQAKLIRDSDKEDILFIYTKTDYFVYKHNELGISSKVLNKIYNHALVDNKDVDNDNDYVCQIFSFAFDINYDINVRQIREYLKLFYEKVNDNKFDDIYKEVDEYLESRLENVR